MLKKKLNAYSKIQTTTHDGRDGIESREHINVNTLTKRVPKQEPTQTPCPRLPSLIVVRKTTEPPIPLIVPPLFVERFQRSAIFLFFDFYISQDKLPASVLRKQYREKRV